MEKRHNFEEVEREAMHSLIKRYSPKVYIVAITNIPSALHPASGIGILAAYARDIVETRRRRT
eukprot:2933227-Pyramimonas_sp.AAC.1